MCHCGRKQVKSYSSKITLKLGESKRKISNRMKLLLYLLCVAMISARPQMMPPLTPPPPPPPPPPSTVTTTPLTTTLFRCNNPVVTCQRGTKMVETRDSRGCPLYRCEPDENYIITTPQPPTTTPTPTTLMCRNQVVGPCQRGTKMVVTYDSMGCPLYSCEPDENYIITTPQPPTTTPPTTTPPTTTFRCNNPVVTCQRGTKMVVTSDSRGCPLYGCEPDENYITSTPQPPTTTPPPTTFMCRNPVVTCSRGTKMVVTSDSMGCPLYSCEPDENYITTTPQPTTTPPVTCNNPVVTCQRGTKMVITSDSRGCPLYGCEPDENYITSTPQPPTTTRPPTTFMCRNPVVTCPRGTKMVVTSDSMGCPLYSCEPDENYIITTPQPPTTTPQTTTPPTTTFRCNNPVVTCQRGTKMVVTSDSRGCPLYGCEPDENYITSTPQPPTTTPPPTTFMCRNPVVTCSRGTKMVVTSDSMGCPLYSCEPDENYITTTPQPTTTPPVTCNNPVVTCQRGTKMVIAYDCNGCEEYSCEPDESYVTTTPPPTTVPTTTTTPPATTTPPPTEDCE